MKEKDNLKIKEDYLEKIKLLKKYDKYYYSNNNPLVDDSTYDKIKNYVLSLEKKYSFLKSNDSPSLSVGFKPSKNFKKVDHKVPMLSLGNAFNKDDLINFEKKIKNISQVYSEIWESKEINDYKISKEESLRGREDKKFSSCLYLEFTNGNDAVFLMDDAKSIFNEAEIGAYQLISTLT